MPAFVRFEKWSEDVATGKHQFGTHVFKVYLSNAAPNVASHQVKADLAEISGGSGYTAGGHNAALTVSRTGGVTTVSGTDITITADGGSIGPFRYAVLYNDSQTSPVDPLVGYWDYGSSISLNVGEALLIDFEPSGANAVLNLGV